MTSEQRQTVLVALFAMEKLLNGTLTGHERDHLVIACNALRNSLCSYGDQL